MADYYVSNNASNGYIVGSDTGAGTSKADPFLTLDAAISAGVSGDKITVNDGTYTPTTLTYWNLSKELEINPENPRATTLTTTDANRMFNVSGGITFAKLGAFILDGLENPTALWYMGTLTNPVTFTFTGTHFKDGKLYCVDQIGSGSSIKVILDACKISGTMQRGGVYMPTLSGGGIEVINGLEIAMTNKVNAQGGAIYVRAQAAGVTCNIDNVSGSMVIASTAVTANYKGVSIRNIKDAIIKDSQLDITGVGTGAASATLFEIAPDATGIQDSSNGLIDNCTGQNNTSGGFTALIGTDVSAVATDGFSNSGTIQKCNFTGGANSENSLHGPMMGHNTDGRVMGNTTSQCAIGSAGLLKGTTDAIASGNKGSLTKSSFCYQKGCTTSIHTNNICIVSSGYLGTPEIAAYDDTAGTPIQGLNGQFVNNVITGTVLPTIMGVQGTAGSAGADTTSGTQFRQTHYDLGIGTPILWRDGDSTTYTTLTAWNASALTTEDAVSADLGLDANYLFPEGSAYLGIGVKAWTGSNPIGNDGEPFSDIDTDISHIQSKYSVLHPSNT